MRFGGSGGSVLVLVGSVVPVEEPLLQAARHMRAARATAPERATPRDPVMRVLVIADRS
jgi:hypothetical protein